MSWKQFNLQPWIDNTLEEHKFLIPTPIQEQVIPLALKKQNLIVSSPTGTGKTHAFIIPILNQINITENKVQAIIISPTRELAQQIYHFTKELVATTNIKVNCFTGGKALSQQEAKINNWQPHIVIGTISRLKMLYENNSLNLTTARTLVLDECDMLLDLGFIKEMDYLISKLHEQIQIMVFSATINQQLTSFLKKYLTNSVTINLNQTTTPPNIEHIFINTPKNRTTEQLLKLIEIINPYFCLVFVNNKTEVQTIGELLINAGKKTALLHGGLTARNRSQIFKRIKSLDYQYLVCTDVGARGIDIPGVSHVISLELPMDVTYYLHRAGRTGRNNNSGISYVFFDAKDSNLIGKIKKLNINIKYYKIKHAELLPETSINFAKKSKIKNNALAQQTINQFKSTKKIKPGYKKTFKQTMDKIEKSQRKAEKRQIIKTQRKKQRKFN